MLTTQLLELRVILLVGMYKICATQRSLKECVPAALSDSFQIDMFNTIFSQVQISHIQCMKTSNQVVGKICNTIFGNSSPSNPLRLYKFIKVHSYHIKEQNFRKHTNSDDVTINEKIQSTPSLSIGSSMANVHVESDNTKIYVTELSSSNLDVTDNSNTIDSEIIDIYNWNDKCNVWLMPGFVEL
ncbi:hypothetical protein FQR65_LT15588 [Abscondita terminalis]|nr:hypothetical protein FQR65_LT15588 [Abscondita terminalis]